MSSSGDACVFLHHFPLWRGMQHQDALSEELQSCLMPDRHSQVRHSASAPVLYFHAFHIPPLSRPCRHEKQAYVKRDSTTAEISFDVLRTGQQEL
jgi:hypothetical protein